MNISSIPTHSIPLADDISMDFVKVMGRTFMMGNDKGGYEDERPVHPVFVQDFWIGVYPVTNEQYAVFLNDYGNGNVEAGKYAGQNMVKMHQWGMQYGAQGWFPAPGYEQHPATNTTWYGAYSFGEWLSVLTGKTFRLLHEAEWEYAAGGGYFGSNDSFLFSGSNKLDDVGWYETNSHDEIKQVGLKQPNQLGLYDMSGNIGEWCMDHWHDDYTGAPMDGTAWLSDDESEYRVVRGGCYYHQERYCRVTSRSGDIPEDCGDDQGFRICENHRRDTTAVCLALWAFTAVCLAPWAQIKKMYGIHDRRDTTAVCLAPWAQIKKMHGIHDRRDTTAVSCPMGTNKEDAWNTRS